MLKSYIFNNKEENAFFDKLKNAKINSLTILTTLTRCIFLLSQPIGGAPFGMTIIWNIIEYMNNELTLLGTV